MWRVAVATLILSAGCAGGGEKKGNAPAEEAGKVAHAAFAKDIREHGAGGHPTRRDDPQDAGSNFVSGFLQAIIDFFLLGGGDG